MLITRTSQLTGKEHTLDLPVSEKQLKCYEAGFILLQNAFPNLPAPQREFIKSGITPEEWAEEFGPNPGENQETEMDLEENESNDDCATAF